jgi:hypothetical protein
MVHRRAATQAVMDKYQQLLQQRIPPFPAGIHKGVSVGSQGRHEGANSAFPTDGSS